MKITHNKVGQNLSVRDTNRDAKASNTKNAEMAGAGKAAGLGADTAVDSKNAKTDALSSLGQTNATKINLSNRAQDLKRAQELARATPDIDEEKVDRLQKLIDSGKYSVDASEIAGKMLDEHANWE